MASKHSGQAELQEPTGLVLQGGVFDYGALTSAVRKQVVEEATEIRRILQKTAENIVDIGIRLNLVHDRIGRDHFQAWLEAEFQWDQSTASNYMRAAAVFCEVKCLERFQPAALYELIRKRVPEEARTEAIDRARNGELITKVEAETIVRKHSTSPPHKVGSAASQICRSITRITKQLGDLNAADAAEIHRHLLKLLSELERLRSSPSEPATDGQAVIVIKARPERPSPVREKATRKARRSSRHRKKRRRGT